MLRSFFILCTVLLMSTATAQRIEKVFLGKGDSSSNLFIAVHPTGSEIKAYLVLVPGMFQTPDDVLIQTELPRIAARQGIMVFIPTLRTGIASFGIDSASQSSLIEILAIFEKRYQLKGKKFFLGGFSIGGSCTLKYAEDALRHHYTTKPAAAFAIDAPLDFERMYYSMKRESRLPGTGKDIQEENNYILKRILNIFGSAPDENLAAYHRISPYSFSDTSQQAIKPLANLPIRLYTEPDVHWWMQEGLDYYGMNAFDFAAMINELKRMGNKKAELITTTGKGFRKPGNRKHPHSWSIVEATNLVQWLLSH